MSQNAQNSPGISTQGVWQPPPDPFEGLNESDTYVKVANQLHTGVKITLPENEFQFFVQAIEDSVRAAITFGDAGQRILPGLLDSVIKFDTGHVKLYTAICSQEIRELLQMELEQAIQKDSKQDALEYDIQSTALSIPAFKQRMSDSQLMSLVALQLEKGKKACLLPNEFHHFSVIIAQSYNEKKFEKILQTILLRCQFAKPSTISKKEYDQLVLDYKAACKAEEAPSADNALTRIQIRPRDDEVVVYQFDIPDEAAQKLANALSAIHEYEESVVNNQDSTGPTLQKRIDVATAESAATGKRAFIELTNEEAMAVSGANIEVVAQQQINQTELLSSVYSDLLLGNVLYLTGPEFAVLKGIFIESADHPEQDASVYQQLVDFIELNSDAGTYKSARIKIQLPSNIANNLLQELKPHFGQ